jgi:hypothetical protein
MSVMPDPPLAAFYLWGGLLAIVFDLRASHSGQRQFEAPAPNFFAASLGYIQTSPSASHRWARSPVML